MNSNATRRSRTRRGRTAAFGVFRLFVFAALAVCSCAAQSAESGSSSQSNKPQTGLKTTAITIAGSKGQVKVEVELARTEAEQAKGLMFRTELEDGKGMLFVFDKDEVRSFWMKNTLIPLSIAYIAYDGTIIDIRDMHPHDTSSVHSSRSVRYALEVPQGWFGRVGVSAGDKVDIR